MAGNVVPPVLALKLDVNIPDGIAGNTPKKQPT